jgi:DNA-binding response OmpR family regulator
MPEKILVVEDDQTLRETLAYNLSRQGYLVKQLRWAGSLRRISENKPGSDCPGYYATRVRRF